MKFAIAALLGATSAIRLNARYPMPATGCPTGPAITGGAIPGGAIIEVNGQCVPNTAAGIHEAAVNGVGNNTAGTAPPPTNSTVPAAGVAPAYCTHGPPSAPPATACPAAGEQWMWDASCAWMCMVPPVYHPPTRAEQIASFADGFF